MATGVQGTTARKYSTQQIHYLRLGVTFADNGQARAVGVLPAGAIMLQPLSGVAVTTVFNAGTSNTINIGTSADDDLYGTLMALGTKAFVALDEAATATNVNTWLLAADTTITATVVLTGTAATTGSAEVLIAYVPDNDK